MKRALIVILFALPAFAASDSENYYRVELIVFAHSSGQYDAWPVDQLSDFSAAADPLWQDFALSRREHLAEREQETLDSDLRRTLQMIETISSIEQGQDELIAEILRPEPWRALDEFSDTMLRARSRLERSADHEVLASLAWYQPLERTGQRAVRLHDERVLAADWLELTPQGSLRRNGQVVSSADMLLPRLYFRLDGQLRLRQGQFSHADLNLHWRRPLSTAGQDAFDIHRLEDSRVIRPDRLEYFDSSWLGALLLLTPWTAEEPQADELPPTDGSWRP